ncbi:MAG: PhnD/SsuA/transferrin family substrate-binding protein [Paracoccaceae bacterium]
MIASLMMYRRPEIDGAIGRYWALIREELATRGIDSPENLAQDAEEFAVWTAPDLVLAQTCGMPYRTRLHDRVTLIGTPDFGVEGCPPGYYRSIFVIRADDPRARVADFADSVLAFNAPISQSGYAAPWSYARARGFRFARKLETGSHRASARAVAEGAADIAALDAVSWRLIARYEPFAAKLAVLDATEPTPGLPYIAGPGADAAAGFAAVAAAIARLDPADRMALGLKGMVAIPAADYLAIENPTD